MSRQDDLVEGLGLDSPQSSLHSSADDNDSLYSSDLNGINLNHLASSSGDSVISEEELLFHKMVTYMKLKYLLSQILRPFEYMELISRSKILTNVSHQDSH